MIEFKNVTIKNFNQKEKVLENINLSINDGSFITIIGNSGVGKTTFLNSLARNCNIINGEIIVGNNTINNLSKKELMQHRKSIGWVSQKNTLIDELTVYDNLRLNYRNNKNILFKLLNIMTKSDKEKIISVLEKLNISDKCYQKVKYLSGGQQRRVEIAKLLLNNYKIIVADEPLSNLDTKASTEVLNLLKMVGDENKSTIIITIHDIDQIINNIDQIVIFKNKQLVFDGSVKNISREEIISFYE